MEDDGSELVVSPKIGTFLFQAFNFFGALMSPLMVRFFNFRFILISGELVAGILLGVSGAMIILGQSTVLLVLLFLFMFYVSVTITSFTFVYVSMIARDAQISIGSSCF